MKIYYPLEIAYCIEEQFEPETRVILLACGGLWTNKNKKIPYEEWIKDLLMKATKFCEKEGLK